LGIGDLSSLYICAANEHQNCDYMIKTVRGQLLTPDSAEKTHLLSKSSRLCSVGFGAKTTFSAESTPDILRAKAFWGFVGCIRRLWFVAARA
jgi:hypothetical protein